MKNLKNALLLKQLYLMKILGYRYMDNIVISESKEPNIILPNNIENLEKQAKKCMLCELSKTRKSVLFGAGNQQAKIMFIGDAPSSSEDNEGRFFVGRTGEMLQDMITKVLKLETKDTYATNLVKCKPYAGKKISPIDIHACHPYLMKQVELIQPKVIVTLGERAYQNLSGDNSSLEQIRGSVIQKNDYTIIPTYHPSFLLKNPSYKKFVMEDLKKIKETLEQML
jgi:DNA polymerase